MPIFGIEKLGNEKLPIQFQIFRRPERVLVSVRILFKKISIMPKVQSPKLNGSICNIPISEIYANCMTLPRSADSNGLIVVKLKRKVEHRVQVLFEPVRPSFVESFLKFLKQCNHFYSDMEINADDISESLTGFQEEKDYTEGIMTKNVSQHISIILEQNFPSDQELTNETYNTHNNLDKEKETLYEKMMSSLPQPL